MLKYNLLPRNKLNDNRVNDQQKEDLKEIKSEEKLETYFLGNKFSSPIGLGPNIDLDGTVYTNYLIYIKYNLI